MGVMNLSILRLSWRFLAFRGFDGAGSWFAHGVVLVVLAPVGSQVRLRVGLLVGVDGARAQLSKHGGLLACRVGVFSDVRSIALLIGDGRMLDKAGIVGQRLRRTVHGVLVSSIFLVGVEQSRLARVLVISLCRRKVIRWVYRPHIR